MRQPCVLRKQVTAKLQGKERLRQLFLVSGQTLPCLSSGRGKFVFVSKFCQAFRGPLCSLATLGRSFIGAKKHAS